MHGDATQFPVMPLSERAAQVPLDAKNTASPTRARFAYQDELAALIVLERLASGGLEGVLVERATDLAVIPIEGEVELIAIKHRDQVQRSATYWTVGDLASEVLPDLHRYWMQMDRACTVAFATNAGFNGDAYDLTEACDQDDPILRLPNKVATHLRNRLKMSKPELENFLSALTFKGDHPSREHISATGIGATAALLELHRTGPITTAPTVYHELCALIEDRSTQRAPQGDERGLAATLTQTRRNRCAIIENRQYLPAPALLEFILRVHDRTAIAHIPEREAPAWQADAAFVGRAQALEHLDHYLKPGSGEAVAPLVVRGTPGCGKSALALHYAATRSDQFRTVRIDGADRSQITAALTDLRPDPALTAATLPGPVAPALPQNTALLIVIDGVVDPQILTGLVPATSLCRVLITANGRNTLPGWNALDLDTWDRSESLAYLRLALPEADDHASERLAATLHDHPLGISQAAAYCRSTNRTIEDYLRRFQSHPAHMLERDSAPGHPEFITTTTELLLTEAEHRTPHAVPLAQALALLAAVPIGEGQLHASLHNPELIAPPPRPKAKIKRWWGFTKTGKPQARAQHDRAAMTVPGAASVIAALNDETTMNDAIDALVRLSLLRRDPKGLVMHPLVALVIRAMTPDASIALALACSWFFDPADDSPNLPERQHVLLPHVHALTSQAVRADFEGPVVFAWCHWLSTCLLWLPAGPHIEVDTSRYLRLRDLAARGYVIANAHFGTAVCDLDQYLNMTAVWGHVLRRGDEAAAAFGLFEELLGHVLRLGQTRFAVTALINMGTIAEDYPSEELRPRIDTALANLTGTDREHDMITAAIDYVHAIRYRHLGDLHEAKTACERALAVAQSAGPDYRGFVEILFGEAAEIARDLGEIHATASFSARRLDVAIAEQGLVPDRLIIQRLCAAVGGALDVVDYFEAKRRLAEARELAGQGFTDDPAIQAMIAGADGRYAVNSGDWDRAENSLQHAIALQQRPDCPELGGLAADYFYRSIAQHMRSEFTAAQESAQRGLELDLRRYEPRHPQVVQDYVNLAEINASARRDIDLAELADAYATEHGHDEVILVDRAHPNGHRWWAGVYLGRTDKGRSHSDGIDLARRIMAANDREVLDTTPHRSEIHLTVADPLNVVIVHEHEGYWIVAEALKYYMYIRDVFTDYTELDFGLEETSSGASD